MIEGKTIPSNWQIVSFENLRIDGIILRRDPIDDSVGKFCTDNWTERKRYQPLVQNKLLSTIQAYSLGFLTGNPMPWKRFCLFCFFHASLSIVDCSIQLVYTKFPNRVIDRGHRRCIGLAGFSASRIILFICIIWYPRGDVERSKPCTMQRSESTPSS